jgi:hypothetical protein
VRSGDFCPPGTLRAQPYSRKRLQKSRKRFK